MVPIRDPGLIGRKIDCPKCKYRFVVEKPKGKAKDDDDDSAGDTPAPTKKTKKAEGAAADTRVPAKNGKKPGAGAKSDKVVAGKPKTKSAARRRDEDDEEEHDRPRKKKSGASMTVIIGASLAGLALVLLIVGGLFMAGVFGGKSADSGSSKPNDPGPGGTTPQTQKPGPGVNPQPNKPGPAGAAFISDVTNLLPNDSETVVNYQIDKLHNSALGQAALSPGVFSEKAFQDTFTFPLYADGGRGVERVVTAVSHTNNWVFTVLHTQKAVTINKDALIANLQLEAHDDQAVNGLVPYSVKRDLDALGTLLIKANRPHADLQMVFLDNQTLVFADPAPMKKFLDDVKEFKGHPKFKTLPPEAPPANQNPGPGGMNPNGGGLGPNAGGSGPMPGGSGPMGGMKNPNGGGLGPNAGGSGPMGSARTADHSGWNGAECRRIGADGGRIGADGGRSGTTGAQPWRPAAPPSQPVGSYLTLDPAMKAFFDRIEKTDQPLLLTRSYPARTR